ncbi:HNH endonuclease [Nocardia spumae]|uniref:HNH endonuclease n=1 Tax=Nocardia spumae TaxID=2887190 RepID=UPI001D141274
MRDGYRCHICRRNTDRSKVVPHPKAPTIDHLIPLSLGGTHEPANVATACFLCNSRKGAIGAGDQLALLG